MASLYSRTKKRIEDIVHNGNHIFFQKLYIVLNALHEESRVEAENILGIGWHSFNECVFTFDPYMLAMHLKCKPEYIIDKFQRHMIYTKELQRKMSRGSRKLSSNWLYAKFHCFIPSPDLNVEQIFGLHRFYKFDNNIKMCLRNLGVTKQEYRDLLPYDTTERYYNIIRDGLFFCYSCWTRNLGHSCQSITFREFMQISGAFNTDINTWAFLYSYIYDEIGTYNERNPLSFLQYFNKIYINYGTDTLIGLLDNFIRRKQGYIFDDFDDHLFRKLLESQYTWVICANCKRIGEPFYLLIKKSYQVYKYNIDFMRRFDQENKSIRFLLNVEGYDPMPTNNEVNFSPILNIFGLNEGDGYIQQKS
jgi:hypothetical protein